MKNWKNIAIIILSLSVIFLTFKQYETNQWEKRQLSLYVNHLYYSIDGLLYSIEQIVNDPTNELTEQNVKIIDQKARELEHITRSGVYVNEDLYRGYGASYIILFVLYGGIINSNEVDGIWKDGKYNEEMGVMLEYLYEDIKTVHAMLYSEQTRQEKENATIDDVNKVAKYLSSIESFQYLSKYKRQQNR
ncbi:hypothetical protein [Bacillus sp. FJAT-45066]|uniref:hypothetical protein n=1 Tax=Bacillus sp. FJAT-45066 TaxID=2011010 RepID=UPI000BB7E2CA|nr:hypothetical protein [Bacillus sp. FJAT-45066]